MNQSIHYHLKELNYLVTICVDGTKGYQKAAENAKEDDLKTLFEGYATERNQFATELKSLITSLGGQPDEDGGVAGALHRTWIDIKESLTGHDRKALLDSCEKGEQAAVNAYKNFLDNEAEEHRDRTPRENDRFEQDSAHRSEFSFGREGQEVPTRENHPTNPASWNQDTYGTPGTPTKPFSSNEELIEGDRQRETAGGSGMSPDHHSTGQERIKTEYTADHEFGYSTDHSDQPLDAANEQKIQTVVGAQYQKIQDAHQKIQHLRQAITDDQLN